MPASSLPYRWSQPSHLPRILSAEVRVAFTLGGTKLKVNNIGDGCDGRVGSERSIDMSTVDSRWAWHGVHAPSPPTCPASSVLKAEATTLDAQDIFIKGLNISGEFFF